MVVGSGMTTKVSGEVPMLNPATPKNDCATAVPKSAAVMGPVVVSTPSTDWTPMPVKTLGCVGFWMKRLKNSFPTAFL